MTLMTTPTLQPPPLPRILPVILSGGAGTRLWPLSRRDYPKQLLPLMGEESLFEATLARVADRQRFLPPLVICNQDHRFLIAEKLRAAGATGVQVVLEPAARNTAPAIAAAAAIARQAAPEDPHAQDGGSAPLLLVLPSDHVIAAPDAFLAALDTAAAAARAGALVTFGITPTHAETGYGYIARGRNRPDGAAAVVRFVEKPDRARAEAMLASGDHLWNGGIFLFAADRIAAAIAAHAPAVAAAAEAAVAAASRDLDFIRLDAATFAAAPAISIDYAVMEQDTDVAVVPVAMGWSDVGSWSALWTLSRRDPDGNAVIGTVVADGVRDCYLRAESRLLAAVDVEGLVIVETEDAVLVAPKARAQEVRRIVERLKREGRREAEEHRRVYRPWGWYQEVDAGSRFKVKRLMVSPGAALSLQMHHHRAEHWVVVQGTAAVSRDGTEALVRENESVYIPAGTRHRLANPGRIPLHLIEVQSGAYLEEDDIIRFDDRYNRA